MPSDRHLLALSFASGEDTLSARRFSVSEGLSQLFCVDLVATSPNPDIDLESILGKPASFRLMSDNPTAPERLWSGVCSYIELVHGIIPHAGVAADEQSTYYLQFVPSLWVTTQRRDNRIFQQKTLPVIVQSVLDEWKIKAKWELKREVVDEASAEGPGDVYRKHDFIVQYGESDFQFICRLLERAGITFYFRFEGSSDTQLVLSDMPHQGTPRSDLPIDCFDTPPLSPPPEYLTHLRLGHTVQPGAATMQDYDFRRSYDYMLRGETEDKAPKPEDFCEQYRFVPGASLVDVKRGGAPATPQADDRGIFARHHDSELKDLAQRHLQSLRKRKRWIHFESNCPDLAPGVLFSVARHPRTEITTGKQPRFLVSESCLEGTATGDWTFSGKAAFTDYPWVPDQNTATPRIYGMQSALVVGSPGDEEIHTDELGRVRVQFHWDREGKYDDKSSCWVRVSQDWAGAGFGAIMLPRVGQEVLVAFYEGDPEHPVVVGRVYNEVCKVPYKLPDHETRSTWKTDSSPSSDGFNEIMLEDFEDKELLYVQAERDLQKLVKEYETSRTGHDRVEIVGNDRSTVVAELDARMVAGRYLLQMMPTANDQQLKIQKQEEPKVSPLPTTIDMVDERIIFTTGKATVAFDGKDIRLEAKKDITIVANKGDVILEGSHAYFNSLTPAPAPKPEAFEALTPGTYSSQAADAVAALQQKLKRDQEGVDIAAPDAPAWDGSKPEVEKIICELVQTQLFCEHDKAPRMPDKDKGLLEVVPTSFNDTLTLKAKHNGACPQGKHPAWKISGPSGTETLVGTSHEYKVGAWRYRASDHSGFRWLPKIRPKTYNIYVAACQGIQRNYQVLCYPNDTFEQMIETKEICKWEEGLFAKAKGVITGFLEKCGLSTARSMLDSRTNKLDGPPPVEPIEVGVRAEFLVGQLGFKAKWTEWPDDHRAFWKWSVYGRMYPLIGVQIKIPITPKVPPPFDRLGDAYLFVALLGRITLTIAAERKTPDSKWAVKPKAEATGEIVVRVGGEAHLMKKDLICLKAFGETSIGGTAAYADRGPLERPGIKLSWKWGGLKIALHASTAISWKWLANRTQWKKEFQLVKERELGSTIWEPFKSLPAAADKHRV